MRLSGNGISLGAMLAGMNPQLKTLDLTNATLDLHYWDYAMLSEQFKPLQNCNVYISSGKIDKRSESYLVGLENRGYIKKIIRRP